ncbi:MAG: TetR/AcrR family transcriptional regulator [Pseudomonadota bacterium]
MMPTKTDIPNVEPTSRQQKAQATRLKLVRAAMTCVERYGYSGASVSRIIETAGVSRGAYLHHFKAKHLIFRAVALQLVSDVFHQLSQLKFDDKNPEDTLRLILHSLWEDILQGPEGRVFTELMLAARTDEILATHMRRPAFRALRIFGWAAARRLPTRPDSPLRGIDVARIAHWSLRGMALEQPLSMNPLFFRRQIDLIVDCLSPHLASEPLQK